VQECGLQFDEDEQHAGNRDVQSRWIDAALHEWHGRSTDAGCHELIGRRRPRGKSADRLIRKSRGRAMTREPPRT
jgi:hypothetical protein